MTAEVLGQLGALKVCRSGHMHSWNKVVYISNAPCNRGRNMGERCIQLAASIALNEMFPYKLGSGLWAGAFPSISKLLEMNSWNSGKKPQESELKLKISGLTVQTSGKPMPETVGPRYLRSFKLNSIQT